MSFLRELQAAVREGLDDLLNAGTSRDEVDEVVSLLEADLAEARAELDLAEQERRRLRGRIEQERRDTERLQEQAREAVHRGDDDAGREFMRQRRRTERGVAILEAQQGEHEELVAMLADHIEELQDKLQELHLRRDFLRTRGRVFALRERFERYRRDFGLDAVPPADDDEVAELPDETLDGDRVPAQRLEPDESPAEPAPQPRGGRGEVPLPDIEDPGTGPMRTQPEAEPETDADDAWTPKPINVRAERERLLRTIERRQASAAFDAEIEDELDRLKAARSEPGAEAAPEAPEPSADDGPDVAQPPESPAPDDGQPAQERPDGGSADS